MNLLVSVIIVNWNGKQHLQDCLSALFKISYSPFEVIVVDNASSDGSVNFIKEKFPKVKIVQSKKNLGFAGGNDLGYKIAKGKYILFLSNDCIVTKGFLSKLVEYLNENPSVGIVQPTVMFHRPKTPLHNKINSIGSYFINTGFLYHQDYGKTFLSKKYSKPYEVFSAYGASFLIRKKIVDEIGLFDPDYFIYFEETDLCHRVWLAGYSVVVFPTVHTFHKRGQSSSKKPATFIQFHSFKNRFYSYLKNFSLGYLLKVFILHLLICEAASFLYLFTKRRDYAFAIQKAIFWNIKNYKKLIIQRNKIQKKIRKVPDKSFMPKLTKKIGIRYYYYLSRLTELEKY